jgi:hypothetical protein
MRAIIAALLACLVVLFALLVLVSEDASTPSGSGFIIHGQRVSDVGDLLQAIMLHRQRGSDYQKTPNTTIVKAQQALKDDGFYSGPIDGTMTESTREALRSFQESNQLNVTGTIDRDTARQLGLPQNDSLSFNN